MLCAEDEQGRTCWMTAFRLLKVPARVPWESCHLALFRPGSEMSCCYPSFTWGLGSCSQKLHRGKGGLLRTWAL